MKLFPLTLRFALLPVAALLSVSCKNKDADTNPYANNPYYGPSGGGSSYGSGGGGGEYPDVQPSTPPPSTDYGYTAPPPAPSYSGGGGGGGASSGGGSSHTVVKGDTLFSLARRYNTSVNAIKSANGLSSDTIRIGQTLTIP